MTHLGIQGGQKNRRGHTNGAPADLQLPPSAWRLEHVTCDAWRESGRALIAVVARRVPRPLDASDDAWRQQEGSHKNKRTKVLVCSGERCKKTESAVGSAGRAATRRHVEAKNDCTRCHISHTLLLREHNSLDTVCPLACHMCVSLQYIHTYIHRISPNTGPRWLSRSRGGRGCARH